MFIINEKDIEFNKLKLLSDEGSECVAYKYDKSVVKFFRPHYKHSHITIDDIFKLRIIPTKRILFPTNAIVNRQNNLIGYQMPLIEGEKDIQNEPIQHIFDEMQVLQDDMDLLDKHNIALYDINPSNSIYNGKLYLIDPGNYVINDINVIKRQIDPINLCDDNKKLLRIWNENKINQLFDMLLFSQNLSIDAYRFRLIVQFFIKEKEKRGVNYNLEVFKDYFDSNLTVKDSVDKFFKEYIKENPKEREWYLSSHKH